MAGSRGQDKKESKNVVQTMTSFVTNSAIFYDKCRKPDREEYMKILQACLMGFIVMGSIGYLIKLIFIPINNILLS